MGSLVLVLPAPGVAQTLAARDAAPAKAEAATVEVEWQVSERGGGWRGGEVAVALTAEPRTYLPLLAIDNATQAVVQRLHASLVRRDGQSFEFQPALAKTWTISPDHRHVRLELRRGVRFSDGEPFDADDVAFSFRAAQDPAVGSPQADLFVFDGKMAEIEVIDRHVVQLTLPVPHPDPLWLINDLPILPEHLLGEAYRQGKLAESWSVGAPPSEMAGLGPFRLARHEPGRRLTLERNPHYWRRDGKLRDGVLVAGTQLPYLDRLVFDIVADETTKVLRFRAGETHLLERIPGSQFDELVARGAAGEPLVVRDLGAGLGFTFVIFNLNEVNLPDVETRQRWFRIGEFRRALAMAVDRRAIARIVYHGHATPVVSGLSPGNRLYWDESLDAWSRGQETADLDAAAKLLEGAGFQRDGEGFWLDSDGERIRMTLVTNTSNSKRADMATLLQEDFRRLGLDVTFVGIEFSSLVQRLTQSFDYDLLLLEFGSLDLDPNSGLNVWRVGGGQHFFHLGADQARFPWEAEVDRLMVKQARTTDWSERRRLYLEAQKILALEVPMIFLVAPNMLVGAHAQLMNFAPSILEHPTLWNCDELYWSAVARQGAGSG